MDRKVSKPSKDKSKLEILNKKTPDPGNPHQSTESARATSVLSSFIVNEFGRSRINVDPSSRRLPKPEESLPNTGEDNEERRERKQDMTELQAMWDKQVQRMKAFTDAKILQAKKHAMNVINMIHHKTWKTSLRMEVEAVTAMVRWLEDKQHTHVLTVTDSQSMLGKWDRYMRCDGSPDPVNQREINTYISLREEDTSRDDAACVFEDSRMDLQLIRELEFLLLNSPLGSMPEEERRVQQQTIDQLRRLIMSKLDMATLAVMCDATILAHKETGNLEYSETIEDIVLCIWGNIMKNPRIRSFEFAEYSCSFDIPKTLALTDCAVRFLTTTFDNYSPTSKSMAPRLKKVEAPLELESKEEKKDDVEEKEQEVENNEQIEEESAKALLSAVKLSMIAASSSQGTNETHTKDEEVQEEIVEDYPDPPTPEPPEYVEFEEEDGVIDLRAYSVLGKIYHFNLLQLPPQPRIAGAWTITQLVDPPVISFLEYTADAVDSSEGGKEGRRDEKPPITVNIVLPDDVLSLEQPIVAHWDADRKVWSTKGIAETVYTHDSRTVTIKLNCFGTLCLLQDKHLNLPFTSWTIRPHDVNSAVLSVASLFIQVEIEIKNELCCLIGPTNNPELTTLRDKWVTPLELIKMMTRAGLNFFPSEDSIKFVNIQRKNPITEESMYQQMALTASAMAFSWSKWNKQGADYNEIAFMAAEVLTDEPVPEEAWSVFMATKRRVTKFVEADDNSATREKLISEASNMLSEDDTSMMHTSARPSRVPAMKRFPAIKSQGRGRLKEELKTPRDQFLEAFSFFKPQFKSNIYHLVASTGNEATMARINNTSFLFVDSVYKLLTATRVLSYS